MIDYAENIGWKLDIIVEHRHKQEDTLLRRGMARMKKVRFCEMNGCGRPVIVSDIEVKRDIVKNHNLRFVIQNYSIHRMVNKFYKVLTTY